MSTVRLVNSESYVACIPLDMRDRTASQIDKTKLFASFLVDHAEVVGGHLVDGMVVASHELQHQLAIAEWRRDKAVKLNSHAGRLPEFTCSQMVADGDRRA